MVALAWGAGQLAVFLYAGLMIAGWIISVVWRAWKEGRGR